MWGYKILPQHGGLTAGRPKRDPQIIAKSKKTITSKAERDHFGTTLCYPEEVSGGALLAEIQPRSQKVGGIRYSKKVGRIRYGGQIRYSPRIRRQENVQNQKVWGDKTGILFPPPPAGREAMPKANGFAGFRLPQNARNPYRETTPTN